MNKLLALIIVPLLLISCSKSDDIDCRDEQLKNVNVACAAVYDPVCGCDGQTYSNACIAKFYNGIQNFTPGACQCNYPFEGLVVQLPFGSCPYIIRLANGSYIEPTRLPDDYELKLGTYVQFNYSAKSASSACGQAIPVDIECIREVGCIPLSDFDPVQADDEFEDIVNINFASVVNDCLNVNFSYSGGCADHYFKLVVVHPGCEGSNGTPATLRLEHESNNDSCDAVITKNMSFDLSKIQCDNKNSVDFVIMTHGSSFSRQLFYVY